MQIGQENCETWTWINFALQKSSPTAQHPFGLVITKQLIHMGMPDFTSIQMCARHSRYTRTRFAPWQNHLPRRFLSIVLGKGWRQMQYGKACSCFGAIAGWRGKLGLPCSERLVRRRWAEPIPKWLIKCHTIWTICRRPIEKYTPCAIKSKIQKELAGGFVNAS